MQQDELNIIILDDGRVRVETDTISAPNHLNADQFLKFLAQKLGGETVTQPKVQAHRHVYRERHASH